MNQQVAEAFEQMAVLIELLGEDSFRARAMGAAARTIADHPSDLRGVATGPEGKKQLQAIRGIGPRIADKIIEFATTGKIVEQEELAARVPPGLFDVLRIPGLGPKTVAMLWNQAGVKGIADLERIIADGTILTLPRMGEKAVEKIRGGIALAKTADERLHLGIAVPLAETLVEMLEKVKGVKRVAFGGSLRRGAETIGDIDLLACATDAERVHAALREAPGVVSVLVSGETKTSVRMGIGLNSGRWGSTEGDGRSVQVDLRVVPEASWGAALLYFTGSKAHNIRLRSLAQEHGQTLNEYGLYPEDDEDTPPQARGVKAAAGKSEEEVYAALGLAWIPPELREDRGEIEAFALAGEAARGGKKGKGTQGVVRTRPALIEMSDIVSELHAHTTASDGRMTIVELAIAAKARGFHTIAVTDHSKSSAVAGGLTPERLRQHIRDVRAARAEVPGIEILAGSEVDILADGSLDYDDDLLAELDIVVASPHAGLTQDPVTATKRLLKAIRHPAVNILGHPTGRLLNRRAGLSPDMGALIAAAAAEGVALEVNAHWMRLDLRDVHVRQVMETERGLIAIDCDVHEKVDFDNLRFGVQTAQRGWLEKERCVNAWSRERLVQWLKKGRKA